MAIIENPLELEPADIAKVAERPLGVLTRPSGDTGWKSWLFTIDHKRIGILYGGFALLFFAIGGLEALAIRLQLAVPNGKILSPAVYNQVFTMHGITMLFLVGIPLGAAFGNYLIPIMIGARDVAFPRMNALSLWIFVAGGIFLTSSTFIGGWFKNVPDGGWFNYAPNAGSMFSPSKGIDYYALGLQILGIASLVSAVNLIVTILNMRAEGMSLMRMPIFVWMMLVTQFLLLFAMPVIAVALFLLTFDRLFDANFFNVEMGADPLLWQHLFWIFGHPEVYILILPSFGIISEIIPVFSRKPIFGYPFMVASGVTIGFLGFGVWAHHMFTTGIGPISVAAFTMSTMFVAVPTGVKVINWLATMIGGRIRLTTAMLFSAGVMSMFTIGGLSGVTHAMSPADTQQHDTYYIVAHFHYVIFGGIILGFFGGLYYWWPKMFGYKLNESWGKASFWTQILGFNLTFGPMHILGLQGMSRRIDTYDPGYGFELWNMVSTVGAFVLATGILITLANFVYSLFQAKNLPPVGPDPWDARGLEWMTASPTPVHNFDDEIVVESVDHFWHQKYGFDDDGGVVRIATSEEIAQDGTATDVHLPSPSYFPILLASGLPFIGYGLIYNLWLCVIGGVIIFAAAYGWVFEPPDDPDTAHAHHNDGDDGDDQRVDGGDSGDLVSASASGESNDG